LDAKAYFYGDISHHKTTFVLSNNPNQHIIIALPFSIQTGTFLTMAEDTLARLAREYDLAVRRMSIPTSEVQNTNEDDRNVFLPCKENIDFFSYIESKETGFRRKVSPDHFTCNVAIGEEDCLNRCKFLRLTQPERYVDLAERELKNDRTESEDFMKTVIDDIIMMEADYRQVKWGEPPVKVMSSAHLGKSLSDCTTLAEAHNHWQIMYRTWRRIGNDWVKRLARAAMEHIGVVYDTDSIANRGRYKTCFVRQVTNTLNDVKKKVRGYGERGPNRITLKKDGPAWSGNDSNERGDSDSDDSDGNNGGVPKKVMVRKKAKDEEDDSDGNHRGPPKIVIRKKANNEEDDVIEEASIDKSKKKTVS
jgi:hypothetical protein